MSQAKAAARLNASWRRAKLRYLEARADELRTKVAESDKRLVAATRALCHLADESRTVQAGRCTWCGRLGGGHRGRCPTVVARAALGEVLA
ncbi:MAG TPA: hypothetical protein VFV05_09550 [Methylomirabilota bacterium]|nr:hypothetical protein [Methylomirabilota bacterium]